MIAKGAAIAHTSNALAYAKEKQKTVGVEGKEISQSASMEIDRSLVSGETKEEVFQEFKTFQAQNTRCEKNTLAFVVSPTEADGKNLSAKDFKAIGKEFLQNLSNEINRGLEKEGKAANIDLLKNNQFISYLHDDKKCKHLHIFVNRITLEGKAVPDNFISNRASRSAELVAQQRNMTIAREIREQNLINEKNLYKKQHDKILKAHKSVLKASPDNLKEYTDQMIKQGVTPKFKLSKANKVVGVQFQVGKDLIKGSSVSKILSGARIEKAVLEIAKSLVRNISKGISYGM